jgi:lipopolysaccharide export LptBFGC system permease protein LptF
VAQVFLFTLPNLFKVTIPMAVLWGILLGLSRLASDSEIIAMRASGLGIGYFVRVASIVAVTGTRWGLGNSLYLAPRANQAIIEMEQSLETSQASYEIEPRVFYEDFQQLRSLRAGRALGDGRGQLAPGVHGRRLGPQQSADYDRCIGDRGERTIRRS